MDTLPEKRRLCKEYTYDLSYDLQKYLQVVGQHQIAYSKGQSLETPPAPPVPPPLLNPPNDQDRANISQLLTSLESNIDSPIIENHLQIAFTQLWSDDHDLVLAGIETLKESCKDVHRIWMHLEPKMDSLIMALARQFRRINTYDLETLKNQKPESEAKTKLIRLVQAITSLMGSLFKAPFVSEAISPEAFYDLLESLLQMNLSEPSELDLTFLTKVHLFISNLFTSGYEQNNILLALLRLTYIKLIVFNEKPDETRTKMDTLIKWIESIGSCLNETKLSSLKMDFILAESDQLIRAYPVSKYEQTRDFRLLEAIRDIVLKIVLYKGESVWNHLGMVNLDNGNLGLIKYMNLALDRRESILCRQHLVAQDSEKSQHEPENYQVPPIDISVPSDIPENLKLYYQFLQILAESSGSPQTKLAFDYFNENIKTLVETNVVSDLDPLVQCCTRQFQVLVITHFPVPGTEFPNNDYTSQDTFALFYANISLLKQLASMKILAESIQISTLAELLTVLFSFRVSYFTKFTELASQLQESLLFNEEEYHFDRSLLMSLFMKMLQFCAKEKKGDKEKEGKVALVMVKHLERVTKECFWSLILPYSVDNVEEVGKLDLELILVEVERYLDCFKFIDLHKRCNVFLATDPLERLQESSNCALDLVFQLLHSIVAFKWDEIYNILITINDTKGDYTKTTLYSIILLFLQNIKATNQNDSVPHQNAPFPSPETSSSPHKPLEAALYFEEYILQPKQAEFTKYIAYLRTLFTEHQPENQLFSVTKYNFTTAVPEADNQGFKLRSDLTDTVVSLCNRIDLLADHPATFGPLVDQTIHTLTIILKYFAIQDSDSYRATKNPTFGHLGQLLMKLFSEPTSIGHDFISEENLALLLDITTWISIKYFSSKASREEDPAKAWPIDLGHALVYCSKPTLLLPATMTYLRKFMTWVIYMDWDVPQKYPFLVALTNHLEAVFSRVFIFAEGGQWPLWFDGGKCVEFLKTANEVMINYRNSFMEYERDYKLLEILKRGIDLMVARFGSKLLDTLNTALILPSTSSTTTIADTPIWPLKTYIEHRLKYYPVLKKKPETKKLENISEKDVVDSNEMVVDSDQEDQLLYEEEEEEGEEEQMTITEKRVKVENEKK